MARAKEIPNLDCDGRVGHGAQAVLEARFKEMQHLREAALDFSDPEGVHDMRVASRRLRSALRDFKFLFRGKVFARLNKPLKNLAAALGTVRDLDVTLIALEAIEKRAPARTRAGIERFADERRDRLETARRELADAISVNNFAKLEVTFTATVQTLTEAATGNAAANYANYVSHAQRTDALTPEVSFRQGGRRMIARSFEELHELSRSLYHPLQAEALHDMRIAAKRLRYALELFASCWNHTAIERFAKEVAAMQTSLGDLHDCDEWITGLGRRLEAGPPPARHLESATLSANHKQERIAALWLLQHFTNERTKHYQAALVRWHKWETSNFAKRLAAELDSTPKPNS